MVRDWKLKALTPVWTGDARGDPDRLIPTDIMGSLRWWYEVLVRGLGGKACDPTSDVRCPDHNVREPDKPGHHCVVCELFGCTGWARKIRLMVLEELEENGRVIQKVIQNRIQAGQTFILRFIPLRPIQDEEWCLLNATLRLIAGYGAIGGKTVFKPSEEWGIADLGADDLDNSGGQVKVQRSRRDLPLQPNDVILEIEGTPVANKSGLEQLMRGKYHGEEIRIKIRRGNNEEDLNVWAGKRHHQDFGLVQYVQGPNGWRCDKTLEDIRAYVTDSHWRQAPHSWRDRKGAEHDFSWASLQNFWCVKGRYLARDGVNRSTFNAVVGRKQDIKERRDRRVIRWSDLLENPNDKISSWLAGRQRESKKVFSFKHPEESRRTFGFVKPGLVDFEEMKRRLQQVWPDFQDSEFKRGEQILDELFQQEGGA